MNIVHSQPGLGGPSGQTDRERDGEEGAEKAAWPLSGVTGPTPPPSPLKPLPLLMNGGEICR